MCGSGLSAVVARLVSACLWGGWGSWGGVAGVPCPFPSVLWFVGVRGGGGGEAQKHAASIDEAFILAWGLGAGLSFYGV